jgi:lysozyme
MTVFIPDVSNNQWGSTELTDEGHANLMSFLPSLPFNFAGLEHKMSQGAGYADPYGPIARDWCKSRQFPFIGFHYATTDDAAAQVDNWQRAGGGNNVMLDFEQVDDDGNAMLTENQFWCLANAFNAAGVNVPLAYIPKWYAEAIGMDLTPLRANAIALISSAYTLGYSVGTAPQLYAGCDGDAGEGWEPYCGGVPTIWQFTSSARINGVSVDCNAYHGTQQELASLFGNI